VIWFIAAFVLVVAELMSGTLYLLVIGAGAAAAGVAALTGTGIAGQLAIAAVVSVAGIVIIRPLKLGRHGTRHRNLSFDAGQSVEVVERRPDGSLRVNYRGTQWDARLEGAVGERLVIKETRGNTLILVAES
jgi:membrane protein implicated in regulation of membrane protease activity